MSDLYVTQIRATSHLGSYIPANCTPSSKSSSGELQTPLPAVWTIARTRSLPGTCQMGMLLPRDDAPLARGRHNALEVAALAARTTPAGAGPTSSCKAWSAPCSTPAGAGRCQGRWSALAGPRTTPAGAGPIRVVRDEVHDRRSIPAGAGPTGETPGRGDDGENHPRWRGADHSGRMRNHQVLGPPPLARGRRAARSQCASGEGTTPAGAGPTPSRNSPASSLANHPRWRGADLNSSGARINLTEPPPLARGRLLATTGALLGQGTTPAGAGPTVVTGRQCERGTNHPGRPRRARAKKGRARTTPAGAGPTGAGRYTAAP